MKRTFGNLTPIKVKYCIYARKSMEAEERQALSIDSQIKEMEDIAKRENLEVVCTKTEAHSAKDSGQRPVFNEVIQDIKNKKYNALLTWNTDRLSRNAGDLGRMVDLMDIGLLVKIRTYGQIFTNNPNEKFLLMILGSQAKLENDNRGINVQRGMRARAESGLWPAPPPTGYLNSNLRDHPCEKVIDPIRAPIIKEMFEKVGYEGWTNRQLYFWLKEKGAKTISNKDINFSSIHDILTRTFYYGYFEYPRKSGKWYKGKHTPIITKELFDLVQKVLKQHSQFRSYVRTRTAPFTFALFMRCGLCTSNIVAEEQFKKQKNGTTHRHLYYHCSRSRDRICKGCYITEANLINQFLNLIDSVNVDLIGMKDEMNKKIDWYHGYQSFLTKEPVPERTEDRRNFELRQYAKIVFEDGTKEDKLNILKHLKGKIILRDKKLFIENTTSN